jgi:hypothetical protein
MCSVTLSQPFTTVVLETGVNLGSHVHERIVNHLNFIASIQLIEVESINNLFWEYCNVSTSRNNVLCLERILNFLPFSSQEAENQRRVLFLSMGNASMALNPFFNIQQLPTESFRIKSMCMESIFNEFFDEDASDTALSCSSLLLMSNGSPLSAHSANLSFDIHDVHYGAVVTSIY